MAVSVVDANPTRPDEKIPPLHRDMPPLPRLKGKIMIEKIEMPEMDETYKSAMFAKVLGNKINELCDVVNEQQKQIDKMSFAILDLATPNGENKALESIKLDRTRKALDIAVDALKIIGSGKVIEHSIMFHEDDNKIFIANKALEQIIALEQKDVK